MLGFLIGLITGGIVGVAVMALMNIASQEDERMERYQKRQNGRRETPV